MGTEAREELKAKQLEKVIYFAAYLVTHVDEEKRHADLPNLEAELASEIAEIERRPRPRRRAAPRRRSRPSSPSSRRTAPRTSEIRARQRAVEKEVTAVRERADAEIAMAQARPRRAARTCTPARSSRTSCSGVSCTPATATTSKAAWAPRRSPQLIARIDLDEEEVKLREAIDPTDGRRPLSAQRKQKAIKRLRIVSAFNRRDDNGRRVERPAGDDPRARSRSSRRTCARWCSSTVAASRPPT